MSKPLQFEDWPESIQPGYGPYRAVAERVVDGDTLYVFIDLGLNQYAYASIRLNGVDAPEVFSGPEYVRVWGRATADQLREITAETTKYLLYTEKDKMTFGRYVGILVPDRDGQPGDAVNASINRWMQAQPWYTQYMQYKMGA